MNLISAEPLQAFDFVLFGGTGDLAMRKLLPALYFRHCEGQLPADGRIIGVARSALDTAQFKAQLNEQARPHIDEQDFNEDHWNAFLERVHYLAVDVTDAASYQGLVDLLQGREDRVRVFYLSVAPTHRVVSH